MKTIDHLATRVRRPRPGPAKARVRVEAADREWFGWLRTRTPLYGTRRGGRMAIRPAPQWLWPTLVALTAAAILTQGWIRLTAALAAGGLVALLALTLPWQSDGRCYAHQLRPGAYVRLPRRPWTVARVRKADYFNELMYVEFYGGTSLVYEPRREVTRIRLYGKPAYLWVHGRVMGSHNWSALSRRYKHTRWSRLLGRHY